MYEAQGAMREALVGNSELASKHARRALTISRGRDVEGFAAVAFALAGKSEEAEQLSNSLAKRFPQDTIVLYNYLPCIRAASRLYKPAASAKAVEHLTVAAPYELGGNFENLNFLLYPVYLRGAAYLLDGQSLSAIGEFQKVLDYPGLVRNEPIGAIARLQLARAYARSGDIGKARRAYQEFLTLWKDADPDLRIFKDAKAEYTRLH
jgi:tetratricopeptide (TPR) repeat protein